MCSVERRRKLQWTSTLAFSPQVFATSRVESSTTPLRKRPTHLFSFPPATETERRFSRTVCPSTCQLVAVRRTLIESSNSSDDRTRHGVLLAQRRLTLYERSESPQRACGSG